MISRRYKSRASSGSPFTTEKTTLQKGWMSVFLLTLSNISADITTGTLRAWIGDIKDFLSQ